MTEERLFDTASHQTWIRDPSTMHWRLDIFREPSNEAEWIFRRDSRIRMPYRDLIRVTESGIPYSRPEVALLFKAKAIRPKDQLDFDAVVPHLDESERTWLRNALQIVHPNHLWIKSLS